MSLFSEHLVTAQVLLPRPFDRAFSYTFDQRPPLGTWVEVPFGPTKLVGIVWGHEISEGVDLDKLKPVRHIFPAPPMPSAQRRILELIAQETLMTRGEALRLAMPPRGALDPKATEIHVFRVQSPRDLKLSPMQQKLFDCVGDEEWERSALLNVSGVRPAILSALIKKGALAKEKRLPKLVPPPLKRGQNIPLNDEQKQAAQQLDAALQSGVFSAHLLDGITGSGKTHVYFSAIETTLNQGKQVLWMVPEIALADQLKQRFSKHFGGEPLLWHSESGLGAKSRTWRLAASGAPCVVLGARSALHCNFGNLGLVIVDEEHEQALKQSDMGTYHARDMAEHRARASNAVFVMGSATPSLETERRVRIGQVSRLRLRHRFGAAQIPKVELLDLRRHRPGQHSWLSAYLVNQTQETLARGEQAMLFLNRRGYAPLSVCSNCGYRVECHQCSAWMVEHRFSGDLQCHLCGVSAPKPDTCPSCATSDGLVPCGPGIERLMEEATKTFRGARIGVFSSDTLRTPAETRSAFAAVHDGSLDLLIGTQVLAKGLDFPNLTLVGVVDGDLGLSNEDLRAGERTFQLLHQVTGRAGRGGKPGHAIIQTHAPETALMQALQAHDRDAFYNMELQRREAFNMPPFSRLAALIIAHENPEALEEIAHDLAKNAPQAQGVDLWGPSAARLSLVRGWHRKRFVVRVPAGKRPQSFMSAWLEGFKFPSKTRVNVDIDPLSFT